MWVKNINLSKFFPTSTEMIRIELSDFFSHGAGNDPKGSQKSFFFLICTYTVNLQTGSKIVKEEKRGGKKSKQSMVPAASLPRYFW
jgi:hypothetical protein